jgi:F0F1-type ATP synthase gamma subunit
MCWVSNHQNNYRNSPRAHFPFKVALVVLTGERGLYGSFNNNVLKKADIRDIRMEELEQLGL